MKCGHCGGDTRIYVWASFTVPGDLHGHLPRMTKEDVSRKDVHFLGMDWPTANTVCQNDKCGMVVDRYASYVESLRKEVKRLKDKYEPGDGSKV